MSENIKQIADRITDMREIMELSVEDMAEATGVSAEEYREYEAGTKDFSFSFLYTIADKFGIDITDLLTGESAKLSLFSYVPAGQGLEMHRRKEYQYRHLAYLFKHKKMEPFYVTVEPSDVDAATHKKSHIGHEFNYIIEGSMTLYIGEEKITVHEGDSIYFDSINPHAMQAEDGRRCCFLAIIAK